MGTSGMPRQRGVIARLFVTRSLILATVPVLVLGVVSVVGLIVVARSSQGRLQEARIELATETAGRDRAYDARVIAQAIDQFVAERLDDLIDWTRAEPVIAAAGGGQSGGADPAPPSPGGIGTAAGLGMPLDGFSPADEYLHSQTVGEPQFGDVLVTDAAGRAVAVVGTPTSPANREERWWVEAWQAGTSVRSIGSSTANGQLRFEVAVRIERPSSGDPVGVMRVVINTAGLLQQLAEDQADQGGSVQVQLFSAEGTLLTSQSAPGAVGCEVEGSNCGLGTSSASRLALDQLEPGSSENGYVIADDTIAGYALSEPVIPTSQVAFEVDSPRWIAVTRQPVAAALAPLADADQVGADLDSSIAEQIFLVLAMTALTILLAWMVAQRLAERIAQPINELRDAAIRIAEGELPGFVARLAAGRDLEGVEPPALVAVPADGEVGDLVAAFASLQSTATDLATRQAIARTRDVSGVLLNLGRRNQQLIGRQLRHLRQLEQTETDPELLQGVNLLGRMAVRIRRNAESLLVLAGEESPRRARDPHSVEQVLRLAGDEIEDHARISIDAVDLVGIRPHVVSDLTHLLAEILENAASFSAPESVVRVNGRLARDGSYTVNVTDHGIGMSPGRLAQANARLSTSTFAGDASTSFLGLYVVGRLAARNGVTVRLVESGSAGVTAIVAIPPTCLITPEGWRRPAPGGPGRRTDPPAAAIRGS